MRRRGFSKRLVIVFLVLFIVTSGLFLAPRWLLYADQPVKADVVVLFVGPGFEDRLIEARRLVRKGYAKTMVIPAYNCSFRMSRDGRFEDLGRCFIDQFFPAVREAGEKLPSYYEATHVEALEAKRLMDARGFRSALFVSSPYHMRRIRLISGEVFDPVHYTVRFVPAGSVEAKNRSKRFDPASLRWQASELVKIGWFKAYSVLD